MVAVNGETAVDQARGCGTCPTGHYGTVEVHVERTWDPRGTMVDKFWARPVFFVRDVEASLVSRDFLVSKAHRVRARRPSRCYPAEPSFRTGKLASEPFTLLPQSLHGLVVFTFVANTHTTSHTLGSRVLLGLAANRDLQVYSPSDP